MLKSPSAVSEFAHYFNPLLSSLDLNRHRTAVGCGCFRSVADPPEVLGMGAQAARNCRVLSADSRFVHGQRPVEVSLGQVHLTGQIIENRQVSQIIGDSPVVGPQLPLTQAQGSLEQGPRCSMVTGLAP